jgi:chromosome segregation ATPase
MKSVPVLCMLCLGVLWNAGCANTERQPARRAVASIADTRAELVEGRQEIDDVVQTLNELEARPGDLRPVYARLRDQIDDIEDRADTVQKRVQDMRLRASEYRTTWQQDISQLNNNDLRTRAEDRRERIAERYADVDRQAQQVRASYSPFITELRDLESYLTNDLTYPGVQAAKPVMEGARISADELKMNIDALITSLDDASSRMSPTTAPAN